MLFDSKSNKNAIIFFIHITVVRSVIERILKFRKYVFGKKWEVAECAKWGLD